MLENDTCFENGLVMGSAGYLYYAGPVKTPKKLSFGGNLDFITHGYKCGFKVNSQDIILSEGFCIYQVTV